MICLSQNRKLKQEDDFKSMAQPKLRNFPTEYTEENEDDHSLTSLSSSTHYSNNSKHSNSSSIQRSKISEEVFQMLIVEEIKEGENVKIYDENDWVQVITGKSRKYTPFLELRASLRAGVPRKLRPKIWCWMTDLKKLEKKYAPSIFESLSSAESPWDKAIILDVQRTNVGTIQRNMIFKILRAYANYDTEIGYTQGMNYVVSGILNSIEVLMSEQKKKQMYVMNKAFWIFVYICHELNWREVYKNKMQKTVQMLMNLQKQIQIQLPDIYSHMKENGVEVTLCFCEQFVTILMQQSPVSFQKRTLDLFLLEGEKLLYKMIIRFLQLTKKEILQKNGMEELVQFMKRDLINYCYEKQKNQLNKLFPMPQNEILSSKVSPLTDDNDNSGESENNFFRQQKQQRYSMGQYPQQQQKF